MMRRATIVLIYGGYAAIALFILAFGGKHMMLESFPAAIFAVYAWGGVIAIHAQKAYWRLANAPAKDLDEREIQARLAAYWQAYAVFFSVVFVGLVSLAFGSDVMRIKTWDVDDVSALIWGVFLLGLTLPAAVLMWTHDIQPIEDDA